MCNQIVVRSRVDAEDFDWPYEWACISITDTATEPANLPTLNRVGLLRLSFRDVTWDGPDHIVFCDDHAHEILDFVTRYWNHIDTLLVHCEAGISRSSAVAAALSRLRFGDEGEFLDAPFDPNPLVYRVLREVASGRADYQDDWRDDFDESW